MSTKCSCFSQVTHQQVSHILLLDYIGFSQKVHDPCDGFGCRAMSFECIYRGEFEIKLHPSEDANQSFKVARRSTSNPPLSLSV